MFFLHTAWCALLGLAMSKLFPIIATRHLVYGSLMTTATGLLNHTVTKVAIDKFKLDYLQPEKRGTNHRYIDQGIYSVYVIANIFVTLYFAAWPWAVVPTLSNVTWSLREMTFENTVCAYFNIMLLYDFVYYFGHVMLHRDPLLNKYIHKVHHQLSAPGNLLDNLYVHPIESFFFLWLQIVPLYILNVHIFAVCAYFFSIFAVTSMFHMGVKFPSFLPMLNPKFHDDHHRLGTVNYSFFTEIPDMVFQTISS